MRTQTSEARRDNGDYFREKLQIRRQALRQLGKSSPTVMETNGGYGRIFPHVYSGVADGVVFEKDPDKSISLAKQRPTWAVYECDSVAAIAAGAGSHLGVNFVDVDPWGDPWPIVGALFKSRRRWPARLVLVVNDGLRKTVQLNRGWIAPSLERAVEKYGNNELYKRYLDVCREMMEQAAEKRKYVVKAWCGYHCAQHSSHYAAVLEKK